MSECHEGACTPCARQALRTCDCGKTKSMSACGAAAPRCGQPCGKSLACGHHHCARICHAEPCGAPSPAPRVSRDRSPCGEFEIRGRDPLVAHLVKEADATLGVWPSAGPCELAQNQTCFCGKQAEPNLTCADPTPTCGAYTTPPARHI